MSVKYRRLKVKFDAYRKKRKYRHCNGCPLIDLKVSKKLTPKEREIIVKKMRKIE